MCVAEDAGAADIIAGGRLQLGISRGSPEQVIEGWRYFGCVPRDGETAADMARPHAEAFLELLKEEGFAEPNPRPMFPNPPGLLRLEPYFRRIARANLVGFKFERDVQVGRAARHEFPKFDTQR
jgi:alkanesulfonate monooxygenase SsuD/methylene tetrahydromethanopterin reductase-like flavin-dependent oxidoreductase (luciferase family)